MTEAPRGVLFDLDGTLVDSVPALRAAFERLKAELGPAASGVDFGSVSHLPLPEVFERLSRASGLPIDEIGGRHARLLSECLVGLEPVPGAARLLGAAADLGLRAAIVTNAPPEHVRAALSRTALAQDFPAIVSAVVEGVGKRDPELYRRAADRIGVQLRRAIHIDDDESALAASREAGIGETLPVTDEARRRSLAPIRARLIGTFLSARMGLRESSSRIVEKPWTGPSAAVRARVDRTWRRAREENPSLFDGEATVLAARSASALHMAGLPYRFVHAYLHGDRAALGVPDLAPIGVTGVVYHRGRVLVAERDGGAPRGRAEFAPAGTLTPDHWSRPEELVLSELAEEVPGEWRAVPRFLGLHHDAGDGVWDMVYLLEVDDPPPLPGSGAEHRRFAWIDASAASPSTWRDLVPIGPLASWFERPPATVA